MTKASLFWRPLACKPCGVSKSPSKNKADEIACAKRPGRQGVAAIWFDVVYEKWIIVCVIENQDIQGRCGMKSNEPLNLIVPEYATEDRAMLISLTGAMPLMMASVANEAEWRSAA